MWLLCVIMIFASMKINKPSFFNIQFFVFFCFITEFHLHVFAQNPLFAKSRNIQNHSFSNYHIVRPYKLDLELDINMQDEYIHGIAIYHLKWNRDLKKVDVSKATIRTSNGVVSGLVNQTNDKIILDTKGLIIESVYGMNGVLNWKYGDSTEIFGKALEIASPSYDTIIQIHYRTWNKMETKRNPNFISAIQWLKPSQTHDKKHPFMFSQSQAILARTWLPCMDVPAVKFTYNAVVNYPSELNVVMSAQKFADIPSFLKVYPNKNGEFRYFIKRKLSNNLPDGNRDNPNNPNPSNPSNLSNLSNPNLINPSNLSNQSNPELINPSNPSNLSNLSNLTKRIYFHQSLPITSYLMAIAVGDFQSKKLGENCLVYAEPGLLEKAAYEFADLPKMIDSASALYGKYAWKEYNVLVLPPSFPFGGMENPVVTFATPTIITGDRSLVSLLAHELAHSWRGNLVTNETWNDFWLNEGFTVYFESRIMEKIYGKDYADMLTVLGLGELKKTMADLMQTAPADTRLKLNLNGRNPDDGLTDIAYEKGRFFLLWCEQKLGRKQWDKFLNQYFKKHAFSSSNTESFVKELTQFCIENQKGLTINLSEFTMNVKQWIYRIGFPKIQFGNAVVGSPIESNGQTFMPLVKSTFLDQALKIAKVVNGINKNQGDWIGNADFVNLNTKNWTTHHFLHFLRNLDSMSFANMQFLDAKFGFSKTENSEIAFDWFQLCIKSRYTVAYPDLANFLKKVGRRKFVLPLYESLLLRCNLKGQTKDHINSIPEWKLALGTYEIAREGYHSVTQNSIDALFQFDSWTK
jgi:hypothetical protein